MEGTPAKIADRFVDTEIDDEVVLMRLSDGHMFSLTGTSREIWQCIDGARTVAAVADQLAERHGAPRDTVHEDVATFIAELRDAGLVEIA